MRILQVTSTARRRGAEVFACQLADLLGSRGHRATTVSLEPSPGGGELGFADLGHRRGDPRALRRLASLCRDHDVVVSHGGTTLLPVALCSRATRRPFVYRNIGDPAFWGRARAAGLRIGAPLRAAAHVVALYGGAAQYMTDRYGLDPARITVSPNAVDSERFPPVERGARAEIRAGFGLDPDRPVLGFLGNLSAEKRPAWAVEVVRQIEDAVLLVAGDGPLRGELETSAARLGSRGTSATCRIVGPVDDPARFLSALDVLLLPSVTEGIPGVLLEAALVGVPTVSTDVGGVAETMSTVGAGRCVAADDLGGFVSAVRAVLDDPASNVPDREAVIARHGLAEVGATWEDTLGRIVAERR